MSPGLLKISLTTISPRFYHETYALIVGKFKLALACVKVRRVRYLVQLTSLLKPSAVEKNAHLIRRNGAKPLKNS